MEELEKLIKINKNRILIYRISEGYATPTYTIMEVFLKNSELVKTYELTNDYHQITFEEYFLKRCKC